MRKYMLTMLLLAAAAPGAEPVLANYVPVIDHWCFTGGLVGFAAGVLSSVVDRRLLPGEPAPGSVLPVPSAAVPGIRATGIALCIATLTFAASWLRAPRGLEPSTLYELGNWGGGHVLQLTSSAAMLSVWLILLSSVLGRSPVSRGVAAAVFGLLLLPWGAAASATARSRGPTCVTRGWSASSPALGSPRWAGSSARSSAARPR